MANNNNKETHNYEFPNDIEQVKLEFSNGYGVSIVKNGFSYGGNKGLYELAVLKQTDSPSCDSSWVDKGNFELCYDTPITNDVIGYLTWQEVHEYIEQVKLLNK